MMSHEEVEESQRLHNDDEEEEHQNEEGGEEEEKGKEMKSTEEEEEAQHLHDDDEEEEHQNKALGEDEEEGKEMKSTEEEEEAQHLHDDDEEEEHQNKALGEDEEEGKERKSTEEEEEAQRLHDDVDDDEEEEEENKLGGDEEEEERKEKKTRCNEKKCIPGILYLGHIPPRLRPKHLRNMLSVYGEIGRIFLQPEDRQVRRKKQKQGVRRCDFTEGWVEFRDKRVAKRVAASLHNTPMGSRKRQRHYADLWSIKYLHRFQWSHLNERLVYEQTVLNQRLRTEVSQVKKETNFYLENVEKSERMKRGKKKKERAGELVEDKTWDFTQRRTEEEIQAKKRKKKDMEKSRLLQEKSQSNVSLLAKIFNSSQS